MEVNAIPRKNNERKQQRQGWCKVAKAAEYLDVGERTLREWIAKKIIPFTRLPSGAIRLHHETIDAFLKKREQTPGQKSNEDVEIVDDICRDLI